MIRLNKHKIQFEVKESELDPRKHITIIYRVFPLSWALFLFRLMKTLNEGPLLIFSYKLKILFYKHGKNGFHFPIRLPNFNLFSGLIFFIVSSDIEHHLKTFLLLVIVYSFTSNKCFRVLNIWRSIFRRLFTLLPTIECIYIE